MKRIIVLLSLFSGIFGAAASVKSVQSKDMIVVDRIEAAVIGPESTDVITLSDIKRPGIDGRMRPLDSRIDERRMYQEACSSKLVDKDGVDKALKNLQKDNNLSVDAMNQVFRDAGYSPEEGRTEFEVMTGVNNLMGMKLSEVMVSDKEIREHYNKNPQMLEESYNLQIAQVPLAQAASASDLRQQLKDHKVKPRWNAPYWTDRSEIDEKRGFIFDMPKGQLYIDKASNSYDLIRLVDKKEKRPKPLDDKTYAEIRMQLHQQKQGEKIQTLRAELDDKFAVIRFNNQ